MPIKKVTNGLSVGILTISLEEWDIEQVVYIVTRLYSDEKCLSNGFCLAELKELKVDL